MIYFETVTPVRLEVGDFCTKKPYLALLESGEQPSHEELACEP